MEIPVSDLFVPYCDKHQSEMYYVLIQVIVWIEADLNTSIFSRLNERAEFKLTK